MKLTLVGFIFMYEKIRIIVLNKSAVYYGEGCFCIYGIWGSINQNTEDAVFKR